MDATPHRESVKLQKKSFFTKDFFKHILINGRFKIEPWSLYPSMIQCNVFCTEPCTAKPLLCMRTNCNIYCNIGSIGRFTETAAEHLLKSTALTEINRLVPRTLTSPSMIDDGHQNKVLPASIVNWSTTLAIKIVTAEKFMRLIYSSIMWYCAISSFGSTLTRLAVSVRCERSRCKSKSMSRAITWLHCWSISWISRL